MKPCERKRASSRWATRCSRCRWTVSSVSTPASSKTTGRIGASRRQSASFWFCLRGARSVSSVAAQLGSVSARRSSGGKRPDRAARPRPWSPRAARRRAARGSRRARRGTAPPRSRSSVRDASSRLRQRSICAFRSSWRSRAASSSSSVTRFFSASRSACLDLARQPLGVAVADALPEAALDVVVDHLREAAELLLDRLGLPDEHLEHAVLDALGQHEVVAADLGGRLELAVDAAVALLDAAGVPRQVEVEEIRAVRLEVQALAGGVGGEQDAQRVLRGVGVEPALDLLAPGAAREAVDHLDALVGAIGALDRLLEDRLQVALRALAVLGEDQDAAVVPLRRRALRLLAEGRQVRAEVLADPVDQPPHLGVGQVRASSRRSPASGRAAPARGARALLRSHLAATRPPRSR